MTKYSYKKEEEDFLLNTIRFPNSGKLKQIMSKLPKSNYGDLSTESSEQLLPTQDHRSVSLTRNNNTMISHSSVNSQSLVDNPIVDKNRYVAKSKNPGPDSRRKSTQPPLPAYDRQLSHRDYGEINDYSSSEQNKKLVNKSFDRHRRAESSLLKLKKLKADRASLERYLEHNNSKNSTKAVKINGQSDYNSRLDSLQKAISINSSQIVLAESKLLIRPNPQSSVAKGKSSLGSHYMDGKITAAYSGRSDSPQKKIKSLGSIDMLKNYYKNKRNKYNHLKNAASIQLYGRHNSRMSGNKLKPRTNNSISEIKLSGSLM